jgi:protoheme IX farnesyltransferase
LAAAAGFLLASRGHVDGLLLVSALAGLGLIVASACVFNNYIDRDIDRHMDRTKGRALVSGRLTPAVALWFATALGLLGTLILFMRTNPVTVVAALTGFVVYVLIYSFAKPHTSWAAVIGSVSGAVPPVVGYAAVTGRIDTAAILLFIILVCWQMPHFYAIAIYRLKDYQAAGVPVLPADKGLRVTNVHMIGYSAAFLVSSLLLTSFGYTGTIYALIMFAVGAWWLWGMVSGFKLLEKTAWAKQQFRFSLIVISVWSLLLGLNSFLP